VQRDFESKQKKNALFYKKLPLINILDISYLAFEETSLHSSS